VPWLALRARIVAAIDRLPIALVVIIYGVPFLIVEPLKGVLLWLMATGHFLSGLVSLILLETFGVALLAVIFDLTRERLLTLRWFAWTYEKVLAFHHFADRLISPYKEAVKREWRAFRRSVRERLRAWGGRGAGALVARSTAPAAFRPNPSPPSSTPEDAPPRDWRSPPDRFTH
jgi:hypothetical protein